MSKLDTKTSFFFKSSHLQKNSIGWQRNFVIFGALILIILAYFFWQAKKNQQGFLKRATEHSQMIAGMVSFSLHNSKHSQKAIEKTIHTFLSSTAKFTDYLDSIEPFSDEELAAFAVKAHLAGIKIIRHNEPDAEGPIGWAPDASCQTGDSYLQHYTKKNLYLLVWPRVDPGCILVGFDSHSTDTLMSEIGLEKLMTDMSRLPLIEYIRLEQNTANLTFKKQLTTRLIKGKNGRVAESRIPFGDNSILIVGVDGKRYTKRMRQLITELSLFSILLIALGIFFSWLISRYQTAFMVQVREFEQKMARQHEEASLGRATAIISHEIKNPLNAISMGLQRLQMELDIPAEHENLIGSMRQAVARTNNIITDLKQYSLPIAPQYQELSPKELIDNALTLYREEYTDLGILVTFDDKFSQKIQADAQLLAQTIENIIKNSIEAQPYGGRIDIHSYDHEGMFVLAIENPGFSLSPAEKDKIIEPYFTTKTKGTGLGLEVSRRIIEAHGGTITLEVPAPNILRVIIKLPVKRI